MWLWLTCPLLKLFFFCFLKQETTRWIQMSALEWSVLSLWSERPAWDLGHSTFSFSLCQERICPPDPGHQLCHHCEPWGDVTEIRTGSLCEFPPGISGSPHHGQGSLLVCVCVVLLSFFARLLTDLVVLRSFCHSNSALSCGLSTLCFYVISRSCSVHCCLIWSTSTNSEN